MLNALAFGVYDATAAALALMLIGGGLAVLRAARGEQASQDERSDDGRTTEEATESTMPRLSKPTRLTIGVVLIVIGYHLLMWVLPAQWSSAVAVPGHLWFIVIGGGAAAVALAFLLDWFENRG